MNLKRNRRALAATGCLVAGATVYAPVAKAEQPKCLVVNKSRDVGSYRTLQAAQDAASAGDNLTVKGTCLGRSDITKDLTITGHTNPGFGPATLDGDGALHVVTIGSGVAVAINSLTITNGNAIGRDSPDS